MDNSKLTKQACPDRRSARRLHLTLALAAALGALVAASPASMAAESIAAALASAYMGNPTLNAERARQRATDELVPQALSGWRPTVTAQGNAGYQQTYIKQSNPDYIKQIDPKTKKYTKSTSDSNPARMSITLTQPLFNGFKTIAGTKKAEATVESGKQQLLNVEQTVLLDAATAFMNVIRDRQIVVLREKTVSFLKEELKASNARFSVGEITKTDVAQARAALSLAEAQLQVARANRASSTATFEKTIGHAPGSLAYPRLSPHLPKSLNEALRIAERTNPEILAAAYNQQAAEHDIDVVKGDLLPSLDFETNYVLQRHTSTQSKTFEQVQVLGVLNVPLYQSGQVYSEVRQAKQVESQRRIQIIEAARSVRSAVVQAWNNFVAAGQTITSLKSQVSANRLALEGVKQEALVGTRTTLNVLEAEQTLVTSQISLVTSQRDQIVVAYQLIAATGQMTARVLRLGVPIYDADANQRNVRGKFIGTSVNTVE